MRLLINIVAFQAAWWVALLAASRGDAWLGLSASVAVFVVHLAVSTQRGIDAWFAPLAALLGFTADSLAVSAGLLRFADAPLGPSLAPPWIAGLWLAFGTTINTAFASLRPRLGAAALLGAVCGPLSYFAGAALSAVELPAPAAATAVLALSWGGLVPTLFAIALAAKTVPEPTPLASAPENAA